MHARLSDDRHEPGVRTKLNLPHIGIRPATHRNPAATHGIQHTGHSPFPRCSIRQPVTVGAHLLRCEPAAGKHPIPDVGIPAGRLPVLGDHQQVRCVGDEPDGLDRLNPLAKVDRLPGWKLPDGDRPILIRDGDPVILPRDPAHH